jgi:cytochrome b involved in lipid metabolism
MKTMRINKHASAVIRWSKPLTPTKDVNTAPLKTKKASTAISVLNALPPTAKAALANKKSFDCAISANGNARLQ